MDFLADYWTYHQCYSIPRNYALWSGISLIGAALHRKVHFRIGNIEIHATNYVLLVGPMGNKKSTCCDFAKDVFRRVCPTLPIGASNQSAEDIVKSMADEKFERVYTNEDNEKVSVRCYAFFINEFKNFISYNPTRMVNFLVDIYDRKFYDSGTIKRGQEILINPSVNILACENPEQLIKFMRNDTVTGGMARRVVMINEPGYADPVPRPIITTAAAEAWLRVHTRLEEATKQVGGFTETDDGAKFFDEWYIKNHARMAKEVNPIVKGYLSTKDVHMKKVAMALDVVSDKPMHVFSVPLLEHAMFLLDGIEEHMPKLSAAAGRNEMMPSQLRALELLKSHGGWMPEKILKREMEGDLSPLEIYSVLRHLEDTDQIFKRDLELTIGDKKVRKMMIMLPERYAQLKDGKV